MTRHNKNKLHAINGPRKKVNKKEKLWKAIIEYHNIIKGHECGNFQKILGKFIKKVPNQKKFVAEEAMAFDMNLNLGFLLTIRPRPLKKSTKKEIDIYMTAHALVNPVFMKGYLNWKLPMLTVRHKELIAELEKEIDKVNGKCIVTQNEESNLNFDQTGPADMFDDVDIIDGAVGIDDVDGVYGFDVDDDDDDKL